ncbi:Hypothetical predicted protein [Paramuricea clavata]|uniref:Uncharacterized protein n=1 Tax=Paramuricea clavata TaxID=317549 RepID=A0A7D9HFP5_PARCT|nr:Hypothetical predicted protein [Paramuricea clavata]
MTRNLATNWGLFKRAWNNCEIAARLKDTSHPEANKELRTATLLTCIGSDALDVHDGFDFVSPEQVKDIDVILQKFENTFIGETNETYERYRLNKRDQNQHESVDAYTTTLRTVVKTYNFGQLEDDLIRDRIVMGIRDDATRKKLLQVAKLTLTQCVDICRSYEKTSKQLESMKAEAVLGLDKQISKQPENPKKRTDEEETIRYIEHLDQFFKKAVEKKIEKTNTINGTEIKPLGKSRFQVINPKNLKKYSVEFMVVKENCKSVFGAKASIQKKLLQVNKENIFAFKSLRDTISPATDRGSAYQGLPVRRIPLAVKDKLKDELDRLVTLKVITPVDTPTDWISATVVAIKKDGNIRLCLDPKPLITSPETAQITENEDVRCLHDTRSATEQGVEEIDMLRNLSVKDSTLGQIKQATGAESTLQALVTVVKEGWPSKMSDVPPVLYPFHPFRDELTEYNGVR